MAEEIKSALDAMNAALEGTVDASPTPDTDTGEGTADDLEGVLPEEGDKSADEPAEEAGDGDQQGGDEAEGDESAGEKPYAELVAEAEILGISQRHANGRIKSAAELSAEITAAAKPVKGGTPDEPGKKAGAAKKEPDALNDPLKKEWGPEVNQRIRTLIDRTKQAEEAGVKAKQDFDYLVQGVQSTGASPEQYGETLSWLALFNNPAPEQKKQALDLVVSVAERLATQLGVELKFTDPLEAHQDLKAALQAGQITPQFAREVARTRNQGQFNSQIQSAASQQAERERAAAQEKEAGRVEMNNLEAELRKSDPLFDRKIEAIMPTVEAAMKRVRPSEWKAAFLEIYQRARVAPRFQARQPGKGVPVNQPLRGGKNPAGGAGPSGNNLSAGGPKSGLDAMNEALSRMR